MKKMVFLIPTFIAGMTLVACGNAPKPTEEYSVSLKMTEAMNIDNVKATSNIDYDAKITIKDEFIGYCAVPEALYEVQVNGVQLTNNQYTYTRDNENQARLHIPSSKVNGDIEIFAEAKADTISIELVDNEKKLFIDREKTVIGSGCEINMSLLNAKDEKTLSVPDKLDDLKIICKDSHDQKEYNLTPCCTYTKNDDANAKLIIPTKYNGVVVITGKVIITATAYQPEYTFKEGEIKNITIGAPPSTAKGVECSFHISTSGDYKLPAELEIKVGGDLLHKSMGDYEILGGDTDANVKIKGEKVRGDIVVSGSGQKDPQAEVKYYLGGINEPDKKTAKPKEDFTCKLTPIDGATAPTADNIRVKIGDSKDANKWIIPNDGESGVSFADGILTIDGELINTCNNPQLFVNKGEHNIIIEFNQDLKKYSNLFENCIYTTNI
ncbi:MAG: hypothetical protein MJ213_05670, partial [Bacilli bacterium]|nr:hypothetical protein [Bacilli bacterium]